MVRRRKQEIHVNHERWLVSYADFITLLFAFFVVMYSISQVNQSKYRVLSESFVEAFNLPNDSQTNPNPINNINPSNAVIAPIEMSKTATADGEKESPIELVEAAVQPESTSQSSVATPTDAAKPENNNELKKIQELVNQKFGQLINDQMIKVSSNEYWVQIELNDSILFPSASADPSAQAQAIFTDIASILNHYTNPVQIEGFTDNIPINNTRYPTNWELSSARAAAIVKWLVGKGVAPDRLSAVGYGEFQPVASNDDEAGRAQNRRVAVMIAKRKIERPRATPTQLAPPPQVK
ncbi:MAG: flagellar motor protein MotD [Pseudomonadota bacterium]